jgi:hypothetical protein
MNNGNPEQANELVGFPAGSTQGAAQAPSVAPAPDPRSTKDAPSAVGDLAPVAATPSGTPGKSFELLRRFFWLDDRVAEAAAKGFSKTNAGWAEFELGRQARAGIAQIGETGEENAAVLLLDRAAVLFLLRSHLSRCNLSPTGMSFSEEDWVRARQEPVIAMAWAELSGRQQSALKVGLGPQAELALVHLDVRQRRYLASALCKFALALSEPLEREARLVDRVLFIRWARIGAAALVLLAIAWLISGAIERKFAKPNIALGRPVTISSSLSADAALDHPLLVDGNRANLGFHTENAPNQWVMIDLGSTKNISRVVVYNRVDCCQERAIPLRLEVSDDGTNFKKVVDCTEEFEVWTTRGLNVNGRYVRLRHLGANFLHFAEIEVY